VNPGAVLALLADLYSQIQALAADNERLRAELEQARTQAPEGSASRG
jgi:cell division septum initiation protein DivIVA